MQTVLENIRQKNVDTVYLVHGVENYLMQLVKTAFYDVLPLDVQTLNIATYNMLETSLAEAVEEAMSFSFLSEKKIVFIDNAYFLTSEKVKSAQEQPISLLETYLSHTNPDTILVILAPYSALDNRKKIVKQLKKVATIVDVNPLSDKETVQFVQNSIIHRDYTIDRTVLQLLLERTGYQLSICMQEIDKLCLATLDTKKITKQDVLLLVPKTLEQNVFSLVEVVLKKQVESALQIYRDLVLQKEEPIKLLALLIGQFRLMLQVKILAEKQYQQSDIVKQLKQHPYRVQLAIKQSQYYTVPYLSKVYGILARADERLKTSYMEKHLQVEIALLKIMTGGESNGNN